MVKLLFILYRVMKSLIKHFVIDTVSLYLASVLVTGIVFENGLATLLLAGLALTITGAVIKPVINIMLLPINLITFGLFRWVAFTITLYLVTVIIPGFKLLSFMFLGYHSLWISIPSFSFFGLASLVAFSFLISFISSLAYWILG